MNNDSIENPSGMDQQTASQPSELHPKVRFSYATELSELCSLVPPVALKHQRVIHINHDLAANLHDGRWCSEESIIDDFFNPTSPYVTQSVAQKYGGHQFGVWNPHLGDGRGVLLGEVADNDGSFHDLHLKGAGLTPYSRRGDGRAVLRSTIREYIASEYLHRLGIPSSRALCLISSDEPVYREREETGASLIRTCPSHLRFGQFEYYYHQGATERLQQLFDYTFTYHFAHLEQHQNRYDALFRTIIQSTAQLIAKWQVYGFNHGVMNTDNMSIHGITFDFGPYAFLNQFDPKFICNKTDVNGRYSFERQPTIGLWNLNALAMAFKPYLDDKQIEQALATYEPTLIEHYQLLVGRRFGIHYPHEQQELNALIGHWFKTKAQHQLDMTLCYRAAASAIEHASGVRSCQAEVTRLIELSCMHCVDSQAAQTALKDLIDAMIAQPHLALLNPQWVSENNPYLIPRNQHLQSVITSVQQGDTSVFHDYFSQLTSLFCPSAIESSWLVPPAEPAVPLSCSS